MSSSTAGVPRERQWVETADKVTGLVYFYNRGTRESSWVRPEGDDIVIIVRKDRAKASKAKKATNENAAPNGAQRERKQPRKQQQKAKRAAAVPPRIDTHAARGRTPAARAAVAASQGRRNAAAPAALAAAVDALAQPRPATSPAVAQGRKAAQRPAQIPPQHHHHQQQRQHRSQPQPRARSSATRRIDELLADHARMSGRQRQRQQQPQQQQYQEQEQQRRRASPPGKAARGPKSTAWGASQHWATGCTGPEFMRELTAFHARSGTVLREVIVNKQAMDLHQLYLEVAKRGGYRTLSDRTAGSVGTGSDGRGKRISWMDVFRSLPNYTTSETSASNRLKKIYEKYVLAFVNSFEDADRRPRRAYGYGYGYGGGGGGGGAQGGAGGGAHGGGGGHGGGDGGAYASGPAAADERHALRARAQAQAAAAAAVRARAAHSHAYSQHARSQSIADSRRRERDFQQGRGGLYGAAHGFPDGGGGSPHGAGGPGSPQHRGYAPAPGGRGPRPYFSSVFGSAGPAHAGRGWHDAGASGALDAALAARRRTEIMRMQQQSSGSMFSQWCMASRS